MYVLPRFILFLLAERRVVLPRFDKSKPLAWSLRIRSMDRVSARSSELASQCVPFFMDARLGGFMHEARCMPCSAVNGKMQWATV